MNSDRINCPNCQSSELHDITTSGFTTCTSCGFCIHAVVDFGEEKRKFTDTPDDPHRAAKLDGNDGMMALSSKQKVDVNGGIMYKSPTMSLSKPETQLMEGYKYISSHGNTLHLPQNVIKVAKQLYEEYYRSKVDRQKTITKLPVTCAAIICLACKDASLHFTPKELANKLHLKEKDIRKIVREKDLLAFKPKNVIDPAILAGRFCNKLGLAPRIKEEVVQLIGRIKDDLQGKHPNTIAAACISQICLNNDIKKSQDEIAKSCIISPSTLRSVQKELLLLVGVDPNAAESSAEPVA
eukprot:TRINITY_DN5881_c0_g1_i1.p1 TRINITY_DN5881_c0_g1~~TRINITY_DN5881_c0_g1_i1.p1  ORF type:complete len:314 (-),score=159.57 TRINITY_DN5881_c0_g1_i1:89-976(-)